ncbi:MAG: hypothetical protein AAF316_10425 [Cyanobacteria bacterium P01_A01_bin.80]
MSRLKVSDRVIHKKFGAGEITHVFVAGKKVSVIIKFLDLGKIITDPTSGLLEKIK